MPESGLRQRKKQRTREAIAAAAAALFAERGYENVAVTDVAHAADVSEQTVYNYFPTKERLVLDSDDEFLARLTTRVAQRAPGSSPAAALRPEAVALLDRMATIPAEQARGGLAYLVAVSPAVRRLSLEISDRHAAAVAGIIAAAPDGPGPHLARIQATALVAVFQLIIDEAGRRLVAGEVPAQIAAALRPVAAAALDSLDGWLNSPPPASTVPASTVPDGRSRG
ncbi:MAG TPA: TetR/AcrR family transcriptional regulator [Streptosporangiaceae bacterium]|nr:TetR/AcrR family transcriptional regulator [Streptosporangiaceae bacterium]